MDANPQHVSVRTSSGAPGHLLHRSVAEALRHRVVQGRLPQGSKLPPLRRIAREFDVSTMTVRQAIRALEREGHIYRIAGVGAFVRSADPAEPSTRRLLAFVAMDLSSAFDMAVARGVEKACQRRGWSLQVLDAGLDVELETKNVLRLPESGARGAIVMPPWDPQNIDALLRIQSADFPMVLVDRTMWGMKADLVESDHEDGGYRATRYFLEHGHRVVLAVTHPPRVSSITGRIRGYERALREAGIRPDPDWVVLIDDRIHTQGFSENRRWLGAARAAEPVLRRFGPPVAVLAIDAYTAWGVYEACRNLGLRVPTDVSVIGFDDSEIAHAIRPPMTIIAQRTDEIGRAAVELLERRLERRHDAPGIGRAFVHLTIGVDLIERQSVADVRQVVAGR